jgi:hypothetical protein
MMQDNLYQITIGGHKIDYFYDGKEMCIFGEKRLKDAGIKITGMLTKKLRIHSGVDV